MLTKEVHRTHVWTDADGAGKFWDWVESDTTHYLTLWRSWLYLWWWEAGFDQSSCHGVQRTGRGFGFWDQFGNQCSFHRGGGRGRALRGRGSSGSALPPDKETLGTGGVAFLMNSVPVFSFSLCWYRNFSTFLKLFCSTFEFFFLFFLNRLFSQFFFFLIHKFKSTGNIATKRNGYAGSSSRL